MDFTGLGDFTIHTRHYWSHNRYSSRSQFTRYSCTRRLLDSHCVTPDHRPSYKPLVGQRPTCLVSVALSPCLPIAKQQSFHGLPCCLTCLPVLLGNAARVVYCSLATSVLRLGLAHFSSTRHGMEKHRWRGGGVYRVMRRPRHNIIDLLMS
jgi:hypothetical protein